MVGSASTWRHGLLVCCSSAVRNRGSAHFAARYRGKVRRHIGGSLPADIMNNSVAGSVGKRPSAPASSRRSTTIGPASVPGQSSSGGLKRRRVGQLIDEQTKRVNCCPDITTTSSMRRAPDSASSRSRCAWGKCSFSQECTHRSLCHIVCVGLLGPVHSMLFGAICLVR